MLRVNQVDEFLRFFDIFTVFCNVRCANKNVSVRSILPLHFTNSNSNENENKDMATTKIYVAASDAAQQGDSVVLDLHSLFVLI